jgi:hypothetical protein
MAINSARAVFPEPRALTMVTRPLLRSIEDFFIHGARLNVTRLTTYAGVAYEGGCAPIHTRSAGSTTACRKVSNVRSLSTSTTGPVPSRRPFLRGERQTRANMVSTRDTVPRCTRDRNWDLHQPVASIFRSAGKDGVSESLKLTSCRLEGVIVLHPAVPSLLLLAMATSALSRIQRSFLNRPLRSFTVVLNWWAPMRIAARESFCVGS